MKIIRIILFSLLALGLIACTGIFILFQTFDSDQYLPKFTQKASIALGRTVSIKHVGLGLSSRGITLDAWPLTIADDPDFTAEPFIKVDRVRISLNLRALILQHEIQITHILFQSPQIHFIRSEDGNINIRSIGQAPVPAPPLAGQASQPVENKDISLFSNVFARAAKHSLKEHPENHIKSITIQDASISFIDQSQDMPKDVWLKNINASLNDFSMLKPIKLSFDSSPLVFKSISPGTPDNPVFKNITGVVQLSMPDVQGDIIITDGVIKDFNIIKIVLSHAIGSFGGLGLEGIINKLGADDTVIEKAEAKFSYHDKTAFIDDFLIKTNILEFTAQGSVDQGLNTDMQTMLHLNSDVSATLVNQLEGLKYLCDDSKRIAIGGSVKGAYPHLKYKSDKDFKKKSKKVFNAMFRQLFGA